MSRSVPSHLKEVFGSTALTFSRQLTATVLQLAITVLLARTLGPVGNGHYAVAVLLPLLLVAALTLGIPSANVYFIGRGSVSLAQALKVTFRFWAVLGALGTAVGGMLVLGFHEMLFPGVPVALLWVALALFPLCLLNPFLSSLFQGLQDFRSYNLALFFPAIVTLVAAVVLLGGLGFGPAAALLAWGLGQLSGVVAMAFFLKASLKDRCGEKEVFYEYGRDCLGYGWKAHSSNLLAFVNYRLDVYLVNLLINPAGAGVYIVAVQIAERLWLFSQSVSTVLLPRLAALNDEEDRRRLTPIVARWAFYCGLGLALVMVWLAEPLIQVFFGVAYLDAAPVLLWLLPGIVIFNCARVLANDIAARGRPELNILTTVVTLVVNIPGNLLLIPRLGLAGAAIATSVAYGVTTICCMTFYARLSGNRWWQPLVLGPVDWALCRRLVAYLRHP